MNSPIIKNECKKVVKDSRESYFLEPIKPTDDPITRMLKSWAHAEVFKDPQDIKEYHGIVRIDR